MPGLTPPALEDLRYVAINRVYIPQTEYALSFGFFLCCGENFIYAKNVFEVIVFNFYLYGKLKHYTF